MACEEYPLYRSDCDHLGVVPTTGTNAHRIERAVAAFLAIQRWEIT
ncbi:hypothetical protein SMD11_6145 [Streptomyces albireticuli]|uniref:Uncharacterized protein n=1 Tax=Streptomyces albireticuli TaxID=1940 RepID=A0A1Z2LBY3_9ACTN|nr:hypothetical protein SMD11_6145 [Streptomyces albireticuli]